MAATTIARKHRRTKKVRGSKKLTMLGAAVATATAMTVGMASPGMTPAANAVILDATTTGPLLWALNAVGLNSITVPGVPVLGDVTANLNYLASDPVALYDALNAAPFGSVTPVVSTATRPIIPLNIANAVIAPLLIADGLGVFGSRDAYNALLASAGGNTPDGYTPLTPGIRVNGITGQPCSPAATCGVQSTNVTNLAMVLVNNPFTPNGGIVARFPFAAGFLGVDTTTPTGQTAFSPGIRVNGGVINVALGYNPSADFPASANPFSLANSFTAGLLPTYLLGGFSIEGAGVASLIGSLGALLTFGSTFTSYTTLAPNDLPFMEPMRLPARLFNLISFALGSDLRISTPLADALQPAFEIMVNTGYTDVQTPSEGGTYNRTYDLSAVNTPFRSEAPLTLQESLAVPGDVLQALWDGSAAALGNLFTNGLFYNSPGLIEPGAAVPAPTAATLAKVQPAAASSSAVDVPQVEEPGVEAVSDPVTPIRSKARHSQKASPAAAAAESNDNDGPDANAQKSARGGAGSGDSDNSSKRDRSSRRAG
jgi:hypothetical protein